MLAFFFLSLSYLFLCIFTNFSFFSHLSILFLILSNWSSGINIFLNSLSLFHFPPPFYKMKWLSLPFSFFICNLYFGKMNSSKNTEMRRNVMGLEGNLGLIWKIRMEGSIYIASVAEEFKWGDKCSMGQPMFCIPS